MQVVKEHGISRYRQGCRCRVCIDSAMAYKKSRQVDASDDHVTHGKYSTYASRGCRCDPCKLAAKDYSYRYKLLHRYGITPADFKQYYAAQNGLCAICKTSLEGARLAIDHDHETGAYRGLLCMHCNTGLGSLGDNVEGLLNALSYLMAFENTKQEVRNG